MTGILGVLLAIVGTIYLTPEQLDNTYICLATEEVGIFYGGISGTGLTAYPYKENRTDFKRCKKDGVNSIWILLSDHIDITGLGSEDSDTNTRKSYFCSVSGCVEKDK